MAKGPPVPSLDTSRSSSQFYCLVVFRNLKSPLKPKTYKPAFPRQKTWIYREEWTQKNICRICDEGMNVSWQESRGDWFYDEAVRLVLQSEDGKDKTVCVHQKCFEVWKKTKSPLTKKESLDSLIKWWFSFVDIWSLKRILSETNLRLELVSACVVIRVVLS